MKHITLILSSLLLLSSCRKEQSHYSPGEENFLYYTNMQIDTFHTDRGIHYSMVPGGNGIVLDYSRSWGMNDNYTDNEYSANIRFPISPEQTSFTYTNEQLAEHRCYYSSGGGWSAGYGLEPLDNGTISGIKNTDGSWEILIDVTLKGVEPRLNTSHIIAKGTFRETKL